MSKATLSVEIDAELVDRVRRYSEATGKDVSETMSELIEQLPVSGAEADPPIATTVYGSGNTPREAWEAALTPAVRSILGAGAGPADEEDYREYLMEKYGR